MDDAAPSDAAVCKTGSGLRLTLKNKIRIAFMNPARGRGLVLKIPLKKMAKLI